MNAKSIVDRERLFIQKQRLLAESRNLLDEFMNLSISLNFSKANEIKRRIDEINKEIQTHNEVFNSIDMVMGVEEASELWDLSSGYIKNLCAEGKILCKKIGKTWIIDKNQSNPNQKLTN
ncbi:helix-turn-helix domain-containing protein [Bacillus cereus]|uniref:helix-turn-helix domain-containing protein n=1 Tax=Bacillus cereus group sp. BfR-BA-01353 TaxID=2920316 RepID=UPI001F590E21|nr:helix-turn-helix domain-containing protein [Bacillus cereus group sp. BfR-BA-01353]MEC2974079.1 helix-turn-helix domain-containing protein [Bacillus cereus]